MGIVKEGVVASKKKYGDWFFSELDWGNKAEVKSRFKYGIVPKKQFCSDFQAFQRLVM